MKRIFKNVPPSIENHVFFNAKGKGYCQELKGSVLVTIIFVDDAESKWTEKDRDTAKETIMSHMQNLLSQAREYGAELKLSLLYKNSTVNHKVNNLQNRTVWCEEALKNAGLPGLQKTNLSLEQTYGVNDAPFIFALNKQGRAYACPSLSTEGSEYALVFKDLKAINHEILHCFGAEDLYYPEEVYTLAKKYLPGSIMYNSLGTVDDLTAYLVGWTNTLSTNALDFLKATAHLTTEKIYEALREETKTGFCTKRISVGTYTGNMVEGVIEGQGKLVYDSGDVYEGKWTHGSFNGFGTMIWKGGTKYTGDWVMGVISGIGKMEYESGGSYDGEWKDGKYNGYGTMKWNGGSEYTGYWKNGKINGSGTMKWESGDVYSGEWKDGKFDGYGTMTYKNGSVKTGKWKKGSFIG